MADENVPEQREINLNAKLRRLQRRARVVRKYLKQRKRSAHCTAMSDLVVGFLFLTMTLRCVINGSNFYISSDKVNAADVYLWFGLSASIRVLAISIMTIGIGLIASGMFLMYSLKRNRPVLTGWWCEFNILALGTSALAFVFLTLYHCTYLLTYLYALLAIVIGVARCVQIRKVTNYFKVLDYFVWMRALIFRLRKDIYSKDVADPEVGIMSILESEFDNRLIELNMEGIDTTTGDSPNSEVTNI